MRVMQGHRARTPVSRRQWVFACGVAAQLSLLVACAAQSPAPSSADDVEPSEEAPSRKSASNGAAAKDAEGSKADAPSAAAGDKTKESDEAALAAAESAKEDDVPKLREVLYKVTDQGLVIEVEGARFKPHAKVTKQPGGGFGIELEVEAEAKDDRNHTLMSPKLGPLAIAVQISDKAGKEVAKHSDRRDGDGQDLLLPGNPLVLKRSWPSGDVKGPLWWGQKVHMAVGLWGFGTDADQVRPLKKLFVVELVGGAKPQAVISPPDVK
jgi:hypothetical protein